MILLVRQMSRKDQPSHSQLPTRANVDSSTEASERVITTTRRLSRAQATRVDAMVEAARTLAAERGYDGLSMQAVAERSGVARATIYRYFTTKDDLLAEVGKVWVEEIAGGITALPTSGLPAARVDALFEHIVDMAERELPLTAALVQAAGRAESGWWAARLPIRDVIRSSYAEASIDTAPSGRDVARVDPLDAEVVLTHVLYSALTSLTTRQRDPERVREVLRATVRVVFRGADEGRDARPNSTTPTPRR